MSRIGRMPITLPEGVEVEIESDRVLVTGPEGCLSREFHPEMEIVLEEGQLIVRRPTEQQRHKALHGLTRTLLNNMVLGVTQKFQKQLEIHGVGYRVDIEEEDGSLTLQLGFSHPVNITPPEGIEFEVEPRSKRITVLGADKELVGQVTARIRDWRPPEPYKGKGVRYVGEYVRRKAGKIGKVL